MNTVLKLTQQCSFSLAHAQRFFLSTASLTSKPVLTAGLHNGAGLFSLYKSPSPLFLKPFNSVVHQVVAGIKHVGKPSLRCRHCYFAVKDEQQYVLCTAKARHYQAQKQPGKKWGMMILTHATQGGNSK